ncbi:hypothetical protein [Actinokineospora cianjurensis]|uniref:HTH cro/C1-type domain-containing protein n=1 Tax=Actinokineospora cianjurensis TaxID=585224 RepID=A0A421B300_9PSEU|nr:hypothetical protein [Actinokineospora cianjurensis]RLK58734.1 hypothetical protein CLV68_3209 [Actinokineospora cianjurensis]
MLVGFAEALRELRRLAGSPTYRQLGARAHYSAAALSDAAAGRKLPTLAVTLAYVRACGGDAREWEQRWREAEAQHTHPARQDDPAVPYQGLFAFHEGDAEVFFGRDRAVREVLDRLGERRFVGVFGASGTGKTSVLRAGVAVRWPGPVLVLTPGARPVEECAVRVSGLVGRSTVEVHEQLRADPANLALLLGPVQGALLIVDQFEELFTLCDDPGERAWFVRALVAASGRTRVLLGVRADFYGHCAEHEPLVEALRDGLVLLGGLSVDELREAIVAPATARGHRLEAELVTRLVADAAGRRGVLPMLSHALFETWHRRRGITLTLDGYTATGGIDHAIARTAETVYSEFDEQGQAIAKATFTRLVALGDGDDTKRRVPRDEWDRDPDTTAVLHTLAAARLVTLDRDSVEPAHEALITHWPRLRAWLAEDRDTLRVHRHLVDATRTWQDLDRDPAALYRGALLTRARELLVTHPNLVTAPQRRFLAAAHTAGTANRRRRRLGVVAAVALVVVLAAVGVYAVRTSADNDRRATEAVVDQAVVQARALRSADPSLAGQVALAAYRLRPDPNTLGGLFDVVAAFSQANETGEFQQTHQVLFHPGGRYLYTASGGALKVFDFNGASTPSFSHVVPGLPPVGRMAIDTAGRTLALEVAQGPVYLLDVADPGTPAVVAVVPSADWLEPHFSPVEPILVLVERSDIVDGGAGPPVINHIVRVLDVRDPAHPVERSHFSVGEDVVGFDRAGNLVTQDSGAGVHLWDLTDAVHPSQRFVAAGPSLDKYAALSPSAPIVASIEDGYARLAVGTGGSTRLWDTTDPLHPRAGGRIPGLVALALAPDNRSLALANRETVQVWDISDLDNPRQHAIHPASNLNLGSATFAPDSKSLTILPDTGPGLLWPTDTPTAAGWVCQRALRPITPAEWTHYFPDTDYTAPCAVP